MSKQYATAPKSNKRTVNIATYSVKKDLEFQKTLEAHWFYPFCESVFDAAIVQYKKDKAEGIVVAVANSGQIIRVGKTEKGDQQAMDFLRTAGGKAAAYLANRGLINENAGKSDVRQVCCRAMCNCGLWPVKNRNNPRRTSSSTSGVLC